MRANVIVIGAGHAGLSVSYRLKDAGIEHVVLERGEIGQTWRTQRWDSFRLNTPNWANDLPGMPFHPERPDAFDVQTSEGTFEADVVVCASGCLNKPRLPECASKAPDGVQSLCAADYDGPDNLPEGAVLVVGSAQSGCQITEDLLKAGRDVYLSTSKVGRIPRRYRGRDILEWLRDMGFFDMRPEDLEDPAAQHARQPQISGTDGGHTLSLQGLARDGAVLVGRVEGFSGSRVLLGANVADAIAHADEVSSHITGAIDQFIEKSGRSAPPPEDDPNAPTLPDLGGSDEWSELDLAEHDIHTIIWCTGFKADWSWLDVDAFEEDSSPEHEDGIAAIPGLYFIGFPWLATRKSGIINGIREDSERIADHIARHVGHH